MVLLTAKQTANTMSQLIKRTSHTSGVFIALLLDLRPLHSVSNNDGADIIAGGFDGCYTYFASAQVSWTNQPANWPAIAR